MRALKKVLTVIPRIMKNNEEFIKAQELSSAQNAAAQKGSQIVLYAVVYGGFGLNALVVTLLFFFFQRTTSKRFSALSNNIVALGVDKPLTEKLPGVDEISTLNHVLQKVSTTVSEARRKEQALIQDAVDVICSLDADGKFRSVNNAAERLWGLNPDELIGTSVKRIVASEDQEATANAISKAINNGQSQSIENRIRHANGSFVDALWTAFWSVKEESLFCVVHDISARKEAERLKQEVLAMVSHDLRSPLTSLQLTLNLLKSAAVDASSNKFKSMLDRAENSVSRLIQLINDLLDIDRIEAGGFSLDLTNTQDASLIEQTKDLIQHMADSRRIAVESRPQSLGVFCDQERIIRVLTNLLSNAIKFSPDNSTIAVESELINEEVEFRVIDQGRGMPESEREKVFERYHQVDSKDQAERKGSGLGLAICKALVEAHGGTIGAHSRPGKGSTFWFRIPHKNTSK